MCNVYVKRIFVITEIVRMNAGVSSEKKKVKESQSRRVTPSLDTPLRVPGRGRHTLPKVSKKKILTKIISLKYSQPNIIPSK